jgi:O-antigen ligase
VLMLGGAVLLRFTGPQLLARLSTTFASSEDRDVSSQSRVELWNACIDIVEKNPILGIGPHNFPVVAAQYGFSAGKEAHSVWMQTAAEMGIPGVGFLFLFYLVTIFMLWPLARAKLTDENREEKILAVGIIVAVVGFMVSAQFVSLVGLELPYYVGMIAVSLVKNSKAAPARVAWQPSAAPGYQPISTQPLTNFQTAIKR